MLYRCHAPLFFFFFFLNDTPPTEIYPLPLHDALPICPRPLAAGTAPRRRLRRADVRHREPAGRGHRRPRSEEHTSELQSQSNLVCRLLLEKKKKTITYALS